MEGQLREVNGSRATAAAARHTSAIPRLHLSDLSARSRQDLGSSRLNQLAELAVACVHSQPWEITLLEASREAPPLPERSWCVHEE